MKILQKRPRNSFLLIEYRNLYIITYILNVIQNYTFTTELEPNEFISSLELKVGNQNLVGKVKPKNIANKEFDQAVRNEQTATKVEKSDQNTFSTIMAIPSNVEATITVQYEYQLKRSKNAYIYEKQFNSYAPFERTTVSIHTSYITIP